MNLKAALINFWPLGGTQTAKQVDRHTMLTYYYLIKFLGRNFSKQFATYTSSRHKQHYNPTGVLFQAT